MQLHSVEQKSPEWFALRVKYPLTASEAQAIGNQGKGLETLCMEQMAKRYSSNEEDGYSNEDLERGVELEPQARSLYELETGNTVVEVGFVTNDEVSSVGGASPDGLVNDDGTLEIKAFENKKHFKAIVEGLEIESKYVWQMQMQMLMTGRKWCDFVAFNPNYSQSLIIKRVEADAVMQEKIRTGLAMGEKIIMGIESKIK